MQAYYQIKTFVIITTLLILLLVVMTTSILLLYQKKKLAFAKDLETLKTNHEKNILKTQLEIQESTFQDISREIHDNIGLSLTLAKLNLNTMDYKLVDKAMEAVQFSINLITKSISDLKDISKGLNSEAIANMGLIGALDLEVTKLKKSGIKDVRLSTTGKITYLNPQKELILFRIIQESLNNIIKHANAEIITIELNYAEKELNLIVQDNGVGFNKEEVEIKRGGRIMEGMRNISIRTKQINGDLQVISRPKNGTTILINAPY